MREIKFRCWTGTLMLPVENLDWAEDGLRPYIDEHTWANPATLMQYTGLKDKNGVEIYEGDIVYDTEQNIENGQDLPLVVTYEAPQFVLAERGNISFKQSGYWNMPPVEVVGNIYENKELL